MKVKLELLLSRTVTVNVSDEDLDDLSRLVKQIQSPHQDNIHSVRIVEANDRNVGTSLDSGSALEVSRDQNIVKFGQLIPGLLQKLRRGLNSKLAHTKSSKRTTNEIWCAEGNIDQSEVRDRQDEIDFCSLF